MCLSQKGRKIIDSIPRDRILTETDAPYNEKSDIKAALSYLNLTEIEVYNNFRMLLKGF